MKTAMVIARVRYHTDDLYFNSTGGWSDRRPIMVQGSLYVTGYPGLLSAQAKRLMCMSCMFLSIYKPLPPLNLVSDRSGF